MMKPRQKELDYFRREDAQYYAYYRVPKLLFTHKYDVRVERYRFFLSSL